MQQTQVSGTYQDGDNWGPWLSPLAVGEEEEAPSSMPSTTAAPMWGNRSWWEAAQQWVDAPPPAMAALASQETWEARQWGNISARGQGWGSSLEEQKLSIPLSFAWRGWAQAAPTAPPALEQLALKKPASPQHRGHPTLPTWPRGDSKTGGDGPQPLTRAKGDKTLCCE